MRKFILSLYLKTKHLIWSWQNDPEHPLVHYNWWMDNWYERVLDALMEENTK